MRACLLALIPLLATAQDPAAEPLNKAYEALRERKYEAAIELFLRGIQVAQDRPAIRKDLAYAYLKIGETEAAREQFLAAMNLDPKDFHVALEYAFLCYETKEQARARRVFDRIRKTGDPESRATAEQAFQNIDRPLAEGIARWSKVAAESPGNFMAHYELASLAEQRDALSLAAEHYGRAWRALPARKSLLVSWGRVLEALHRIDEAMAALVAASRGGEPRAAEAARELLPNRHPFVNEFRDAIRLEPWNVELRRDLAFLLLKLDRQPEAEREFRDLLTIDSKDLLSCAQLGFLYLARQDLVRAKPLLDVVLESGDVALANKVRVALRMPEQAVPPAASGPVAVSGDAKIMAERSIQSGFLADALRYLQLAYEADHSDPWVMLKMGWTYNLLHNDRQAIAWFDQARRGSDPKIAREASQAYVNLRPAFARFRTTTWALPFYSSRWNNLFSYGQAKTEMRVGNLPFRPYLSARLLGDARGRVGGPYPQYFSENSVILGVGISTRYWKGLMAWGEAGSAVSYRGKGARPDYRGGVAYGKGWGPGLGSESKGQFFETNLDGVYVSRFGDDFLVYWQNRWGYAPERIELLGGMQLQLFWAANLTFDAKRQVWANFVETGPGVRFRWPQMPRSLMFSINALRGTHTLHQPGAPQHGSFTDVRAGFWYATTR